MKAIKLTNRISTILLSLLLLVSAGMYIFNNAQITTDFQTMGFPTFIIYPLAIAKIIAVIVLLMPKTHYIKDMAYSAIFFNLLLALGAHLNIGDGKQIGAIIGLVFLIISFYTYKKLNATA